MFKNFPEATDWRFIRRFLVTVLVFALFIGAFLIVSDPYNTLHLSPPLERGVVAHNQRFSYPALARSPEFDSAIFGTSTTRMIDPDHINGPLGARFVNLSLNSGTWWEQREMFKLFLVHHPEPKRVAIGLDGIWCQPKDKGAKLSGRLFPPWLYDESPWNDYTQLLNFKSLEHSGNQLMYVVGLGKSRYGKNGYRTLNKSGTPYDLKKAHRKIYGQETPIVPARPIDPPEISEEAREEWPYPNVETLGHMLAKLPDQTQKLLIFVPYHQHLLGAPGGRVMIQYDECKKRVQSFKDRFKNLKIIDFMFRSDFTMNDANYWDKLHFNERAALQIERYVIDYWKSEKLSPIYYKGL